MAKSDLNGALVLLRVRAVVGAGRDLFRTLYDISVYISHFATEGPFESGCGADSAIGFKIILASVVHIRAWCHERFLGL